MNKVETVNAAPSAFAALEMDSAIVTDRGDQTQPLRVRLILGPQVRPPPLHHDITCP